MHEYNSILKCGKVIGAIYGKLQKKDHFAWIVWPAPEMSQRLEWGAAHTYICAQVPAIKRDALTYNLNNAQ